MGLKCHHWPIDDRLELRLRKQAQQTKQPSPTPASWASTQFRKYLPNLSPPSPQDKSSFKLTIVIFLQYRLALPSGRKYFMDDGPAKLNIIPDHFQVPTSSQESPENTSSSIPEPQTDQSPRSPHHLRTRRKLKTALMLSLFSPRRLSWGSSNEGQEKVELTIGELESLRSELIDIEEREALLKARVEHVDEVLRSARLSGYLYIRTRWEALPGEPPPIDDTEVDDWLPRFVVLHGECIFLYLLCTDLSPQDSTLLSDIIEVGRLPSFKREDDEIQYALYILTQHGLRYECSSNSKIQVDCWLSALQTDCKLETDTSIPNVWIKM